MKEQLEEQAALYALGLIEGEESAAFIRRLESDPELRAMVDQMDEAAAALAYAAPARALPPELKTRVLADARKGRTITSPRRSNWIPWALAACLALTCAYLLGERSDMRKRIARLKGRDPLGQIQIASLSSKLENASNAHAVLVWDEKRQRGLLQATRLPPNDQNRDYQLWLVDPRYKDLVSGGVFHVSSDGALRFPFQTAAPVRGAKEFVISLERKGGVTKPKGPIILSGK